MEGLRRISQFVCSNGFHVFSHASLTSIADPLSNVVDVLCLLASDLDVCSQLTAQEEQPFGRVSLAISGFSICHHRRKVSKEG